MGEWLILGCVACWVGYTLLGALGDEWGGGALSHGGDGQLWGAVFDRGELAGGKALPEPKRPCTRLERLGGAALSLAFGATALAYAWFFDRGQAWVQAAAGYITLVPVVGVAVLGAAAARGTGYQPADWRHFGGARRTAIMQRGRR